VKACGFGSAGRVPRSSHAPQSWLSKRPTKLTEALMHEGLRRTVEAEQAHDS